MDVTRSIAILWVFLGTGIFSGIFASGRFADGIAAPAQVVFLRYVGGVVTLALVMSLRRAPLAQYRSRFVPAHLARALTGCFGGLAIIYASAHMPLMDATAISLLYVVLIVALGALVLKERVSPAHWGAVAVSSAGAAVVLLSRGAFQSLDVAYLMPAAIAFAGAVLLAIEALLIRTLSLADTALTVLLHVNVFGLLLMTGPALLVWQPMDLGPALAICGLGPLALSAQYCIIRGYRSAEVSVLGPVDYTWLIFAALIGFMAFGEVPSAGVLAGSALIAVAGIMLVRMRAV
ncbi:DMT family transporter [Thalassococcus sp. S3]|uniref:DMT family transporter n=1 Tax=Thalassococcus sp. S3 TaxID=2017482 RepID=UPI00102489DF|nr:DMT family transporter [Thalassococcus sp. S3]QBF33828.1 hypothetical protein CFI11_21810 [Thalassococcus sp. S3]